MAAGGTSTLAGVRFEVQVVLYHVPDVLSGELATIRYQPGSSATTTADTTFRRVFLDDISAQDRHGQKRFYQVKQNTVAPSWTMKALGREGVLRQLYEQNRATPDAALLFVSNIPAPLLTGLGDAARQSANATEFSKRLPARLRDALRQVQSGIGLGSVTLAAAFGMLRRAKCVLLTEDTILARIRDFATERYGDADHVVHVVTKFIEDTPGSILDPETLQRELDRHGLYRLPVTLTEDVAATFYRTSADLRNHVSRIGDVHIPRDEVQSLKAWVNELGSGSGVAALLDTAGAGKSVIMHDLLVALEAEQIPVLAIKADRLTSADHGAASSARDLLTLPAEPESMLAAAARRHGRAVLIVDQVDALSMTFARNQRVLDVILGLISRASSIKGVAVVFSCRAFDRHYDPKIRTLAATREIPIKPLSKEQIELVLTRLDVQWDELTDREKILLTLPQHLDLFARVISYNRQRGLTRRRVASVQDLYDLLWELVAVSPPQGAVSSDAVIDAIDTLANAIEASQTLSQPASVLERHRAARTYLESAGILRRDGAVISLFHQSFFDYVFSRRFVATNYSLSDYIRRSDQGLFQRPLVVQVLTYLRSATPSKYAAEISAFLANSKKRDKKAIRYHLRHLAFSWFGQQLQLTDQERAIGLSCLRNRDTAAEFLRGCRGNAEWFDVLKPGLVQLLDSDESDVDAAIRFLESVQDARASEVYRMLLPYLGTSAAWDNRVRWCIRQHKDWRSSEAREAFIWFYEHDPEPWNGLDFVLVPIAESNPEFGCRALGVLLGRLRDAWRKSVKEGERARGRIKRRPGEDEIAFEMRKHLAYGHHADDVIPRQLHGMVELARACGLAAPDQYLTASIPWMEDVAKVARSWSEGGNLVAFSSFALGFDEPDDGRVDRDSADAFVHGIRLALSELAHSDTKRFLAWAETIEKSRVAVLHQVLMEAIAGHPAPYAQWACDYLHGDSARLTIGSHGDSCRYSGALIGAIFPHLTRKSRAKLERTVLACRPSWEDGSKYGGITQLELLWDIPVRLLSAKGKKRLGSLKRKFKHRHPRVKPDYSLRRVESPVVGDRAAEMSESEWLSAMRRFDEQTGWGRKREPGSGGGIVELSRQFEHEVSKSPQKYAAFADLFDDTIASPYWAALLTGLVKTNFATNSLYDLAISMDGRRPKDPTIERAIYEIVEQRSAEGVPEKMIQLIRRLAIESSDPAPVREPKKRSGPAGFDSLFHEGFNSVRGRAARLYVVIAAKAGTSEVDRLFDAVDRLAADPALPVRACLIDALPSLMRVRPEAVHAAFEEAVDGHRELLDTHSAHEFIYWSLRRHGRRLRPKLVAMTESTVDETRVAAGRLATLAWFYDGRMKPLYEMCMKGDASLRRGVATVLARNVDDKSLRPRCLNELRRLFDDNDGQVGNAVAGVFGHLPGLDSKAKAFIRDYVDSSRVIEAAPDRVARFATSAECDDEVFSLEIGERLFGRFGRAIVDHSQSTGLLDDDLVNISMTIYRNHTQVALRSRAMDLFEGALRIGSYFASRALTEADR